MTEAEKELLLRVAQTVCHEEQMTVWSGDFASALGANGYLRDLSYDEVVELHQTIQLELQRIIASAMQHPEASRVLREEPVVPAGFVLVPIDPSHKKLCKLGHEWACNAEEAAETYATILEVCGNDPTAASGRDQLPLGHVVLEQAEMLDGRVSQTVRAVDGSEYERIVHADEAYGAPSAPVSPPVEAQGEALKCFICREPILKGQMVLPDYTEGLGHRECFGNDRDGFCNLETGEPLVPDEPLPPGEPYEPEATPVTPPAESGAVKRLRAGWMLMNDNGKRWRICGPAGRWVMKPEGAITSDEARTICETAMGTALASTPAPQPSSEEDCQRCAGNGEVVTDWDRYLKAHPGDVGDEAVAECPECSGTGKVDAAPQPGGAVKVKALEWNPYRAETPFGYYIVVDQTDVPAAELAGRQPFLLEGTRMDLSRHDTLADARAVAQADYECRILSVLSPSPSGWDAGAWKPTHRHVKRGSEYRVIGEAEAQVSTGVCVPFFEEGGARQPSNDWWERDVKDGDRLTVYQGTDGKLWVRFSDEFNDERFSPLPTPPAGEG